ncbi:M14 family zinc carboxypeptidase [Kitasatospora sp. NPDC058397]|uniref:M14 family zinc carboxypeptidase n=1 Tax=unclassified Kitasatospora TaxID=2633591 RepID=UPI003659E819
MLTDTSTSAGRAILLHDRHPTLEELADTAQLLAARHPEPCRVRTAGTSRAGQPLVLLTIGRATATDSVLIVTGAHADEFSGRAGIVELAHRVLAQPSLHEAVTWNFLLCLDPDGARLAEAGAGTRSLPEYFEHYFRPAAEEQPEWAPAIGGRLPESRILLDLIDDLRPSLQFSLHSADVGGTFLQSTCDLAGLAEPFAESAAGLGIPVETGPYDAFWLREAGPGVFMMAPHHIDQQESSTGMLAPPHTDQPHLDQPDIDQPHTGQPHTGQPHTGQHQETGGVRATTWFAPQRYGGETVIVETPVWASAHLGDARPADDPYARLTACAGQVRERGRLVTDLMDEVLPHLDDTALLRAARTPLTASRQLAHEWDPQAAGQRLLHPTPMTEARLAGIELWAHRIPVRAAALLRRAAEAPTTPATARLDHLLQDWCAQYQQRFQPRWLPVARQAEHQANTVQAAVELSRPTTPGVRRDR